jgi:hypothetical protein
MIRKAMLLVGVWLTVGVLGAGPASAGPTATGPEGVRAAATPAAVQVCQGPRAMCRERCRTLVARRRCRPATPCLFKTHVFCRCFFQQGACRLRCKSRLVRRMCNRSGWCSAAVRRCQCGVAPMPPR